MATKEEFKAQIEQVFASIDTDGNGALSSEEAWSYHQQCAAAMGTEPNEEQFREGFLKLDKNADGKVSKDEMVNQALADWEAVNANR